MSLIQARVVRQDATRYHCQTDDSTILVARLPKRLRGEPPAVGDLVELAPPPGSGPHVVARVLPRRSAFTRHAPDDGPPQVIAANVDLLLVLAPLDQPVNLRRLERYLAAAASLRVVVVLTKADLGDSRVELPVPAIRVSARTGEGMDALRALLSPGVTAALVGASGAGKSTLVNALVGEERLATAETRASDGKGRHTTTRRELVTLPNGAALIDTPGMRELALTADADAGAPFADVETLARGCRFSDCRHETEPGCAVREAVDAERLASYHKLRREAAAAAVRTDARAQRAQAREWGKRGRASMQAKRWRLE